MAFPISLITEHSSLDMIGGLTLWINERPSFMVRLRILGQLPERTWIKVANESFCVQETPEEIMAKSEE